MGPLSRPPQSQPPLKAQAGSLPAWEETEEFSAVGLQLPLPCCPPRCVLSSQRPTSV